MSDILVGATILLDGYKHTPDIEDLYIEGNIAGSFDVHLDSGEEDVAVDLPNYGTIKRIYLIAKSGTIKYKLNSIDEEYDLVSLGILSFEPSSLTLSETSDESSGLVEVIIIGS